MPSLVAYLAEYTVNGHVELPAHYTLRDLWTREGAVLLALRSGELRSSSLRSRLRRAWRERRRSRSTTSSARRCSTSPIDTGFP
jgi:hypothetical protein